MRVIVSQSIGKEYDKYKVVPTIEEAGLIEDIECLILHDLGRETDAKVSTLIADFHVRGVSKIISISATISPTLKMVLNGIEGTYFEDEFYLNSEEDLDYLVEEVCAEDTSLVVANTDLLKDFVQRCARKDPTVEVPLYLESVSKAVDTLSLDNKLQKQELAEMGSSVIDVFRKASNCLNSLNNNYMALQSKIRDYESKMSSPKVSFGSGINFFQQYKYTGFTQTVLHIQEVTPCKYLTSFLVAYRDMLQNVMNKRAKLVVITQRGAGIFKRYSEGFTMLTQDSINELSLYKQPCICTNTPKFEVLDKLIKESDSDIVIFVDRLNEGSIISGKVVKAFASSGKASAKLFNVPFAKTIVSHTENYNALLSIPHIMEYPSGVNSRLSAYASTCQKQFDILNRLLEIK